MHAVKAMISLLMLRFWHGMWIVLNVFFDEDA